MTQTVAKTKKKSYVYAVGRRKSASARVRMYVGEGVAGSVEVNGVPHTEYFSAQYAPVVLEAIELILEGAPGSFTVKVEGGGVHSQAEAVRHGIARALVEYNADWKALLKPKGLMTRDPRAKERKKPGLRRARRAPQWSKR
ncbi:MAG: 30S ribosomal protein S9 [Candidatus Kerfeldbacteria bacterium CG15_BIG_FIL_POST_REV_8_21_14_020_45_12]|uniref:30S ribosomal protein S9 n=1 Tax=Candidatus Kerfeldbacteria bacterium CG15_BIG_FIL_POST_REV_8_21_14_020_45_12 TaxID=2014247 RepID=A0A2M7H404_9BACT|nr:MAG: 30S ribosomal protein S9 [Candidatus Kerfeldbacteria bacterium CG15_BIG_FIL_POST_REV_8_21_14_020_45_12]PJA93049.1 MAG: 30S ribosomal protein S9 [Candidatus Kerfeldbacteria bacterium CG_4_9_14_3_um_filter_45_8]